MNSKLISSSISSSTMYIMKSKYDNAYIEFVSVFKEILDTISWSTPAMKLWNEDTQKNTCVFITRLLISHFKIPHYSPDNYDNLIHVLARLRIASKSKNWVDRIKYMRSACDIYMNNAIQYTGYNSVIYFEYMEGNVRHVEDNDVYDFLNENGQDVVSVIQVNLNTYLIMCLEPEKLTEYINNLNDKIIDIETGSINIETSVFKTKTFVFNNVTKLPIKNDYSWKTRKHESYVIVPTQDKMVNIPIENIKQWNQVKRAYSKL